MEKNNKVVKTIFSPSFLRFIFNFVALTVIFLVMYQTLKIEQSRTRRTELALVERKMQLYALSDFSDFSNWEEVHCIAESHLGEMGACFHLFGHNSFFCNVTGYSFSKEKTFTITAKCSFDSNQKVSCISVLK